MPGIAGIISKIQPKKNKEDLHHMIECMMHEPFYNSGVYVNDQIGLYVGWVCHKDSFSDCMPIFNEKRNIVMFFAGENFVEKDVMDQLKRNGHDFDPINASYLIHLYEENGDSFIQNINGQFQGILLDLRESKMILFNDRYGMQRLYYNEGRDSFLFSSEAKSLLKIRPELQEIKMQSLGEFFSCGCILENRTLFSNIFLLPGGSLWTFRVGQDVQKDHYFKPEVWESQPIMEGELFYQKLRKTFSNVLKQYFSTKQLIGMSLTGGLDTRLIMAYANNPAGELPCYTFGGMYRDSYDVKIARKVASACQQNHHVLRVAKEFLSDFAHYAEKTVYISDGCLDACGSPELYINKMAREIAPIRMTGNYGSEILRSIRTLKFVCPNAMLFHPDFIKHIKEAGDTFAHICNKNVLSFILFRQAPWYGYGRFAIEQSQLTIRMPFMDTRIVKLVYQAPVNMRSTHDISLQLIKEKNPMLFEIKTDMNAGGTSSSPISKLVQILRTLTFRAEGSYSYGLPHWLAWLDNSCRFFHPERFILGYHKYLHFRLWFRNELSHHIREILLDRETMNRPYLNREFIVKIVDGHLKGYRNYTYEINKLLTTEMIHRNLIKRS